jgi:hypothetical protein
MEWIAAFITTGSFAFIVWLGRNLIITRLTASVKYEYERNLEKLKSELRENEENVIDELKKKSLEIESLRNVSLSGIVNSQAALIDKRIKSVETLWKGITNLSKLKASATVMKSLNVEEIEKSSNQRDENIQLFLNTVGRMAGDVSMENLPKDNPQEIRPFVSAYAWSLYSAYSAIVYRAFLQLELLKKGLDTKILNNEHVIKLIEIVLPHQKPFIEKYGVNASYYLLDEIEELLLKELQSFLRGDIHDKENMERAHKILSQVNKIQEASADSSSSKKASK